MSYTIHTQPHMSSSTFHVRARVCKICQCQLFTIAHSDSACLCESKKKIFSEERETFCEDFSLAATETIWTRSVCVRECCSTVYFCAYLHGTLCCLVLSSAKKQFSTIFFLFQIAIKSKFDFFPSTSIETRNYKQREICCRVYDCCPVGPFPPLQK